MFLLKDFSMVSVTRYIAFSLAFYLIFTFIPYFYRRENFELYVIKLFTSFLITYLYSLILFLGLAAMLFTVDKLFSAGISSKLYFDIWLIVAGIFAPGFFLADIPEFGKEFSIDNYPKVLRVLLLNIVMPMIVVYSIILYVYFVKIIITWKWPEGIISNLVLWFSIISTIVIFFTYILRDRNKWVRIFTSIFPKLILPLLAMMFVSIAIRVNAYGITENRYFVIVAGLWVTGCMLYFSFTKSLKNTVLLVSLALIAVLSVSGPWSGYSVSKLSQNMRFEKILKTNNMLKDSSITKPPKDLQENDKKEISEIIAYFNRYHSLKDVKYLPVGFKTEQAKDILGFELQDYDGVRNGNSKYFDHYLSEDGSVMEINDYNYFLL